MKNKFNSDKETSNIIKEKRIKINQTKENESFIKWIHLLNKSNKLVTYGSYRCIYS